MKYLLILHFNNVRKLKRVSVFGAKVKSFSKFVIFIQLPWNYIYMLLAGYLDKTILQF